MPHIEERTISRVGGSSLMVTLPKGWLRYAGIQAGDKVEVITNGTVTIRPKKRLNDKSLTQPPSKNQCGGKCKDAERTIDARQERG